MSNVGFVNFANLSEALEGVAVSLANFSKSNVGFVSFNSLSKLRAGDVIFASFSKSSDGEDVLNNSSIALLADA